jgi:phosphoribosylformimino-5-aminoimidazole carboxamide ribotide isomerase
MIAIPAVDLREGRCVQLVGGEYTKERIRLEDPIAVAREWARLGFQRVHIVDLDAATGRGSNMPVVRELLRDTPLEAQVGGGLRDTDAVERVLEDGARRVVVGTRAVEDPEWVTELAHEFPGEVIVAADVRDRRVVTRGWRHTLARDVIDLVEELNALPLAGLLVTAVHKEGRLAGTDLPLMEDVADASRHPVIASGGITSVADIRALADRGVAAAVIGMALYAGTMDARLVAEEFCE